MRTFTWFLVFLIPLVARRGQGEVLNPQLLLADGIVNLGALPGERGVWELNYIENTAHYVVSERGKAPPTAPRNAWGSRAEPQMPFMPWSAARYDYNVRNLAKYDPESF